MSAIERAILIAEPPQRGHEIAPKNRISKRVTSIDRIGCFGHIESREVSSRDSEQPIRVRLCINTMPSGVARPP